MSRTALVTGGNRGIGKAIVAALANKGLKVLLGCRDVEAGKLVCKELPGADVHAIELLLDKPDEAAGTIEKLSAIYGPIDILINNAGILLEQPQDPLDFEQLQTTLNINFMAPAAMIEAVLPSMRQQNWGRIVNISSGWGSFGEGMEGPTAYACSKAILNALTYSLAKTQPESIKINAACPGWVHTRMGGKDAPRTPEEGAKTPVWLATLPDDGPTGGFFRDKTPIAW